ncbi:MAG: hypothetical protein NZ889_01755 [Candidatus Pacearchaeota archaeon]|nr:hypothetical protein [Candidatus Pacearchaeota archaeon]
MKTKEIFTFVLFCLLIFFTSGQKGCETTQATKRGIDFTIISRPSFLTPGSTIHQGDTFYVGVKIENYDTEERTGKICIRDDVEDTFGGISSHGHGECDLFVVRAAEKKQQEKNIFGQKREEILPGALEVYFPKEREYAYYNLPPLIRPFSASFYVSLQYNEFVEATATLTTGQEQPNVAQEPSLVKVFITKTLHPRSEGYKIDLTIELSKQGTGQIFSPDFSRQNITQFYIRLYNVPLQCFVAGKPVYHEIELQEKKTIKCTGMIYGKQEQSFPLVINLNYGVIIEKKFGFNIVTKEE